MEEVQSLFKKGQRVIISESGKGLIPGQICIIKEAIPLLHASPLGHYKYDLSWSKTDNPGKLFPDCLNDYYYLEKELRLACPSHPSILSKQDLPNI